VKRTIATSILTFALILIATSFSIAAPADPCALLTAAQATAALGGSVTAGKPLASTVCQWDQQGKTGDMLLKLTITVITVERHNRTKSSTTGTVTNIGGVGDDAFFATMNTGTTTNTTLNLKKGDSAVVIRVYGGKKPVEEYQAKEKAVAQAILPKL